MCWIAEIAGKPYSGLTLSQAAALKKTVARKQALRQKMNEMEITHSYGEFPGGRTRTIGGDHLPSTWSSSANTLQSANK